MMVKSAAIGVRVQHDVKAAAIRAAEDDHRSVASLLEKLLIEYLVEHGYLKTPAAAKAKARQ